VAAEQFYEISALNQFDMIDRCLLTGRAVEFLIGRRDPGELYAWVARSIGSGAGRNVTDSVPSKFLAVDRRALE